MNVSLTPELEKFITEKVESGKYSSAEEVIREGLRLLREHEELAQKESAFATRTPQERAKAWEAWCASHDPKTPVILDDSREAIYGDDGR